MEKEKAPDQIPSWAKSWLTIAETSEIMYSAGLEKCSVSHLRYLFSKNKLPFYSEVIAGRIYCVKDEVINYLKEKGLQYHPTPVPSGFDREKWLSTREAFELVISNDIPFLSLQSFSYQLTTAKALPIKTVKYRGRCYADKADVLKYIEATKLTPIV